MKTTGAIVLIGNPSEGWAAHGPFENRDDATEYAEREFPNDMHWIMTTEKVEDR